MQVKCISLDLDGTTLYDDKNISERTKKSIEQAITEGIQVVIASGRCYDSLPTAVKKITGIEYAITSNGAVIYNLKKNECIRKFSVPEKIVEKLQKITKSISCTFEVFYNGKAYAETSYIKDPEAFGVNTTMVEYIKTTRNQVTSIHEFILMHQKEIESIDILVKDNVHFDNLFKKIKTLSDQIYVTTSVGNRIEISSAKAGKHAALEFILSQIGISRIETASFGNADNDIGMIEYTKYGMAVKNATQKCLDAAWKIVPSNKEDGVAVGIELLLSKDFLKTNQ